MTVQKLFIKNLYEGDGANKSFPITFEWDYKHPERIKVYVRKAGEELRQTMDFSLTQAPGTDTWNVNYPVAGDALGAGDKIVIARELPLYQSLNLVNQGPYFAEDIELTFDEVVKMIQQLNEKLDRSTKLSIDIDSNFDATLPIIPGKSFKVNAAGTGFEMTDDPAEVKQYVDAELEQAVEAKTEAQAAQMAAEEAAQKAYEDGRELIEKDVLDAQNAATYAQNSAELARQEAATAAAKAVTDVQDDLAQTVATVEGIKTDVQAAANEVKTLDNTIYVGTTAPINMPNAFGWINPDEDSDITAELREAVRLAEAAAQLAEIAKAKAEQAAATLKDAYTKNETDVLLNTKANKATTLAGYGITDAYTITEADAKYLTQHQDISGKANKDGSNITKPALTDYSTKIATTSWVKDRVRPKIVEGLSSLGISGSCTLQDVFVAMVDYWTEDTEAWISQSALTSGITDLPTGYGILHIGRMDCSSRFFAEYITDGGKAIYYIVDNAMNIKNKTANDLVLKESISAKGTNYVRYNSGIQMCWGSISANVAANGTISQDVSYGQSFSVNPCVFVQGGSDATDASFAFNNTSAHKVAKDKFALRYVNEENRAYTGIKVYWFAIGRWK